MTNTDLKKKTLEANAKLDLCLCFLNQTDMPSFVQYLKEAVDVLESCRSALWRPCELDTEIRDVLLSVIRSAETRANQYLNLGYMVFGMERLNAAIKD